MSNFDPAALDWASGLLQGWTYDKPVNKWFQGQFRSAHRLTRPCPTCREVIALDVTAKALEGTATNHGLALRRCKKCRDALKAATKDTYAERKAIGAERRAAEPEEVAELEKLRKENEKLRIAKPATDDGATVEELRGIIAAHVDNYAKLQTEAQAGFNDAGRVITELRQSIDPLKAEIHALKAKLAQYDLPAAMAAVAQNKMPWEA